MTDTSTSTVQDDPFAKPAEGSFFGKESKLAAADQLLAFEVLSFTEDSPTSRSKPGEKSPMVKANVHVLTGPNAGTSFNGTPIYGKTVTGQLQPRVGGMVLGRWIKGTTKPGFEDFPPWSIKAVEPGSEDHELAMKWYKARQEDPFA